MTLQDTAGLAKQLKTPIPVMNDDEKSIGSLPVPSTARLGAAL